MRTRAFIHLAVATVAAAGAFTVSVQLGQQTPSAAAVRSEVAVAGATAPNAQQTLAEGLSHPTGTDGAVTPGAGVAVVDESKSHRHVVDPRTGGLISVAGASGTVPKADHLGPMHEDPLPAGVSLDDPTDTARCWSGPASSRPRSPPRTARSPPVPPRRSARPASRR